MFRLLSGSCCWDGIGEFLAGGMELLLGGPVTLSGEFCWGGLLCLGRPLGLGWSLGGVMLGGLTFACG